MKHYQSWCDGGNGDDSGGEDDGDGGYDGDVDGDDGDVDGDSGDNDGSDADDGDGGGGDYGENLPSMVALHTHTPFQHLLYCDALASSRVSLSFR